LGGGQFEVEVEDGLRRRVNGERRDAGTAGDGVGDLCGKDALAFAGVGKEKAEPALEPEVAEQAAVRSGIRRPDKPLAGRAAAKEAVAGRFGHVVDRIFGIECSGY